MRLISTPSISQAKDPFDLPRHGMLVAAVFLVGAFMAQTASAQVALSQSPNLPDTVVINKDNCSEQSDADRLTLRWVLTGSEPAYDIIFRSFPGDELPSNTCPALTNVNVQGVDILSSPFRSIPNGSNEMDILFNVFTRDLTSDDICDEEGIRDTQRTLCLYVTDVNSGLEEFRTQIGTGISVDTQDPDRTELETALAGDGRFTINVDSPTAVGGENLQFEVQYRECSADAVDAGTSGDGGDKSGADLAGDVKERRDDNAEKMDDGGTHDGGDSDGGDSDGGALDGGAEQDAGDLDAGGEQDAGAEDAGGEEDAGVVDTFNDAGTIEADEALTGPSDCGATGNYSTVTEDGPEVIVTGLTNGVQYEIRARAVDDFGNAGLFSERQQLTPVAEIGYLAVYEGETDPLSFDPTPFLEGLTSGDGCESRAVNHSDSPWASLALLALGGLVIIRRRRRRGPSRRAKLGQGAGAALVAFLLATGVGTPAQAALGDVTLQAGVGPYTPSLDYDQSFPAYACLYKDSLIVPRFDVDVGLHLFDGFGSIQLNLGLGVMQSRGKAQPVGAPQVNPHTGLRDCQPVSDTATQVELTMLTLRPGLTYRADQLLDYFNIPLVPYGRVGVLAGAYAFTKSGLYDNARVNEGINPAGVRLGIEGALGLMLALDWWDAISVFSKNSTKRAQALGVFQHAYFYGEVVAQSLDTFGAPGPNLTPTDYLFRTELPIFFNLGVAMEF